MKETYLLETNFGSFCRFATGLDIHPVKVNTGTENI